MVRYICVKITNLNRVRYFVFLVFMSPHVDGRTGKEGTKKRKWRSEESRLENEINQCHRTQDVDRGMALMHELIALDHSPSQQTFTVLLNLVCMHGPERWPDVRVILDCMETHQVALGEAGITALIRLHMASGDAPAALEMLQELEALSEQPVKRRAVLPVLEGVCKLGDGAVAMQLVDMLKRNDVPFQEEEFLALLTLCEHRAQEQRIGMVLSEIREVVYRVSPRLRTKLEAWFTARSWNVHTAHISESGVCSQCSGQLQSVHAEPESIKRIKTMMDRVVLEDLDGKSRAHELQHNSNIFRNGTPQGLRGANELNKFKTWLRAHGPFDLIIDGANLGFHSLPRLRETRPAKKVGINYLMMDSVLFVGANPFICTHLHTHARA